MNAGRPENDEISDDTLIEAVRRGDQEAFAQLLDRHVHHVRAFLALKAPAPHLVDELAHETFVFAYQNCHRFTVGTSLPAWLRAIAWNLLRAEIQRFSREQANQARFTALYLCESAQAATDPCATAEMEYLERCLQQLPAPHRELLALKYREDNSSEEMARRLQRSIAWVYTLLFRLRQQLKNCIEEKLRSERPC
jgi:RNA polymerase sigma-70 factor, ECF subfamily